jgi:hypothetical protein
MLTVTLDTGTLRLVDALSALDGVAVDIAATTVTAREVEGTVWVGKVKQFKVVMESLVLIRRVGLGWGGSRKPGRQGGHS